VSPTAPALDEPADAAAEREPDDAWLRTPAEPPPGEGPPRPVVDWTPETEPETDAAAAASEHVDPPGGDEPAPESIPDVASLDTLLPDASKGGSINPGR
jgi:hypothetical protein